MLHYFHSNQLMTDGYYSDVIFDGPKFQLFKECSELHHSPTLACIPLLPLRSKTSFFWPLIVIPLAILPPAWVLASLLCQGCSKLFFPTAPFLLLAVLLSSLLLISMLFSNKLLLAGPPMLLKLPSTSILLFLI